MNLVVVATLTFCFYGYVAVDGALIWMDWIEFFGKIFLTATILVIQKLALSTIQKLIKK